MSADTDVDGKFAKPQPLTREDLERELTAQEQRDFDEWEARQDAEVAAEYGDTDEDETPSREPTRADRVIAVTEDRAAFLTERRAEIARHNLEIERLTGALNLIEPTEDETAILVRAELKAQLERHARHRDWLEHALGKENRDKLYRVKQKVAKRKAASPRTKTRKPGKWVRGTRYASKPRERAEDWYYRKSPATVLNLVEQGKLSAVDGMYAGIIARHLETHRRAKGDKARRITCEEMATKGNRMRKSAQRSVSRMVRAGALIVLKSGQHTHYGALYTFPTRTDTGADMTHLMGHL